MNMTIQRLDVNNNKFIPANKEIDFTQFDENLDFEGIVMIDDILENEREAISYNPTNRAAKKQAQTVSEVGKKN